MGALASRFFPRIFITLLKNMWIWIHLQVRSIYSAFCVLKNIFKFFLFFVLFDTFDVTPPYTMDESDLDSVLLNRLVFWSWVDGLGYTEISRFVSILNMSCVTKEWYFYIALWNFISCSRPYSRTMRWSTDKSIEAINRKFWWNVGELEGIHIVVLLILLM